MNPNDEGMEDTNRLLLQLPCKGENKYVFFSPCYLRMWILNLTSFDIGNLSARIQVQLKFDVDVTGFHPEMVEHIKQKISLRFHHNNETPVLEFQKGRTFFSRDKRSKKTLLAYRMMLSVETSMIPNVMMTPFEVLNLILTVEVPHIWIWDEQNKQRFEELIKRSLTKKQREYVEKQQEEI